MYARQQDDDTIRTEVRLREVGTSDLKWSLYRPWHHVEVGHRIDDDCPPWHIDALAVAIKGLRGIAQMGHEPIDRERLWQYVLVVLHRLQEAGWTIYSGNADGVLAIVLSNGASATEDGLPLPVKAPHRGRRALNAVDAWLDGHSLI